MSIKASHGGLFTHQMLDWAVGENSSEVLWLQVTDWSKLFT